MELHVFHVVLYKETPTSALCKDVPCVGTWGAPWKVHADGNRLDADALKAAEVARVKKYKAGCALKSYPALPIRPLRNQGLKPMLRV